MKILKKKENYWENKIIVCQCCNCQYVIEPADTARLEIRHSIIGGGYYGIAIRCPECNDSMEIKKAYFKDAVVYEQKEISEKCSVIPPFDEYMR